MAREINIGPVRVQLTSPGNILTLWQDIGGLLVPTGVSGGITVSGRLVLVSKSGNFQVAVGVETFNVDPEVSSAIVQPSVDVSGTSGLGMKTAAGKYFFNFDPTHASNGDVTTAARWRLGLLYGTHTTNSVSRGEALFEATVRYA